MSLVVERSVPASRTRPAQRVGLAPDQVVGVVLGGLAGWLLVRYLGRVAVPLSWQRPPLAAVYLLPAAPVLALLALRLILGGARRGPTTERLLSLASRWAGVWAGAGAVWMLLTVAGLYDFTLGSLAVPDNLVAVLGSSDLVVAQLVMVWVALLVALFATRLGGRLATAGLLALSLAALLSALHVTAGPGHDEVVRPLVTGLAALQVVGLALWLGTLVALIHLRSPLHRLRQRLVRTGALLSGIVLVLGVAAVLAGLLRPEGAGATPVVFVVAQLVAVVLLTAVGRRHLRRTVDLGAGRGRTLMALLAGEVVVGGAVLMIAVVLPVGG